MPELAMALDAKLVVVGGDVKTEEIKLRLPSTIGRGRGTSIVLPHPLVSRQHCELYEQDGQLMVRDLGSLNGTFVNNQKVAEAPVSPGELLTIGTVTFRAVYEAKLSGGAQSNAKAKPARPAAETLRSKSNKAKPPAKPAAQDSDLVDFDVALFADDAAGPETEAVPASQSLDSTLPDELQTEPLKPPAKKPAATKTSAPAPKPSPAKPADKRPIEKRPSDEATIDFNHRGKEDDEDDEPVQSSSDEDLDDFLKSLEN
jgi:predicted component of type VI protein secretion system